MGKKKAVKKTKELSVAIAESSSLDAEGQQQNLTPRKRGRPRKINIVDTKTEVEEIKELGHDDDDESKKVKTIEEKEQGLLQPSNSMKEEASKQQLISAPAAGSRARRKSRVLTAHAEKVIPVPASLTSQRES
ncbi:hypothetical protein ACH5RR_027353 [Cinchona calisaya]|uniref:Uncharacterized protein n=1 Tax=Cinchona calisaya TaxID=153742 RepID=A0ABD2Z569_9GENT